MNDVSDTPSQQTRTVVTERIIAHVKRGWPHLGEPLVRYRGSFCYVSARLPGHRQPAPILRLRYQGSPDRWNIAIYLASDDRYTEAELPFAHRALGIDRSIGLLLPCNVLVRAAADGTVVEARDPQVMVTLTGRPELKPVADEVARRLASALADLTRPPSVPLP